MLVCCARFCLSVVVFDLGPSWSRRGASNGWGVVREDCLDCYDELLRISSMRFALRASHKTAVQNRSLRFCPQWPHPLGVTRECLCFLQARRIRGVFLFTKHVLCFALRASLRLFKFAPGEFSGYFILPRNQTWAK